MEVNQNHLDQRNMDSSNELSSEGSSSYNTSDTRATKHDILVAAILIQDAQANRNTKFKRDEKSVRAYQLYRRDIFKLLLFVCIWGNMFLALFERPAWHEIPYWATLLMEFCFLFFCLFRFFHNFYFSANQNFWRDRKNLTIIISICVICADMLCYIIWREVGGSKVHPIRWSRVIRPLLVINFPEGRQVRKAFRSIGRSAIDIAHGVFLLLASIALFSLMALKLFEMRNLTYPNGQPYFRNYFEIFWELYVLVTTANSPDVMMPAYNANLFYAFFFVCFLLVNLYIFMSIVLAIVFFNYKRHLKNEVMKSVYRKRALLGEAFDIVSEPSNNGKRVTKERFHELLRVVKPSKSEVYFDVLFGVLDPRNRGYIKKGEFLRLTDFLTIPLIEGKKYLTFFNRRFPGCYGSQLSVLIRKAVQHRFFRLTFDFAIFVNAVCIGMGWDQVEWFFLTIYILEIFLKIYTYGSMHYVNKSIWNMFDFFIVMLALVVTIYEAASASSEETEVLSLDFILSLRVLRLVRFLSDSKTFRVILTTLVNIGPSIITYGCVFFAMFYTFAIVGMEAFGGLIKSNESDAEYCGNPALNNSQFYKLDYCKNNFNDLPRAFVILFELMVVNQWHVLAEGFVLMTNKGARVFFLCFHVAGVVVLLNIITAFVLEAFMLGYTVSRHDHYREELTKTIENLGLTEDQVTASVLEANNDSQIPDSPEITKQPNEEKTYFILSDHGFKKIEVVLQEMFQEQIDPTDQGPHKDSDDSDLDESDLEAFSYMRF